MTIPPYQPDDYPEDYEESAVDLDDYDSPRRAVSHRGAASDPIFGLLLAGAIAIGLLPLIGVDGAAMRYTLSWGVLALFGVLAWLLGTSARIDQETPDNLAWGITFGLIVGAPLLLFGGGALGEASLLLFRNMPDGAALAYLLFVMPLAETLFFRGMLQEFRSFWMTGVLSTIWGLVLFFPLMNQGPYPLIIGIVLLMANVLYSYVRERNGLAAAWIAQIVVNLLVFFLPLVT